MPTPSETSMRTAVAGRVPYHGAQFFLDWACPARSQRGRAPIGTPRDRPWAGRALAVCFADANATEYRGRAAASDVLREFRPRTSRACRNTRSGEYTSTVE